MTHLNPSSKRPTHSYISLIASAILSSDEKKMILSDIYDYVAKRNPPFLTKGPGWRNSIRHNLSLNDCFIKLGRSPTGKGHYWTINPMYLEDFRKGNFGQRRGPRRLKELSLGFDRWLPRCPFPLDTRFSMYFPRVPTLDSDPSAPPPAWLCCCCRQRARSSTERRPASRRFDIDSLLKRDEPPQPVGLSQHPEMALPWTGHSEGMDSARCGCTPAQLHPSYPFRRLTPLRDTGTIGLYADRY